MSRSLRVSVILFVSIVNLLVFGAGFVWLTGTLSRYRRGQEEDFTSLLVERMQNLIDAKSIQASGILRWSYWEEFEDAVVIHMPQVEEFPVEVPLPPAVPRTTASPHSLPAAETLYATLPFTELPEWLERLGAPPPERVIAPARMDALARPATDSDPLVSTSSQALDLTRAGFGSPVQTEVVRRKGVILHPLGSARRALGFDWEGIQAEIERAVVEDRLRRTHGGAAVPIHDPRGRSWGGCWFKLRPRFTLKSIARQLLPWLIFSTFSLTLATFVVMQRLVLDPVGLLARGSRRLAAGDRSVQLPEPERGDELAELVRAFNRMASEVQESADRLADKVAVATEKARQAEAAAMMQRRLAATGELAAGIAHEINNPLGGMINAVEVLSRSELDPTKRRLYLQLLEQGLERIRLTVGQVLRLAPRTSRVEPLALGGPIADAVGLLRHRILSEGVSVHLASRGRRISALESAAFDLFSDLPLVRGSANELGQAVLNLLVNALDAIASLPAAQRVDRGKVCIALEAREAELELVIEDDGPGMPAHDLARAADPFYTTKESGRGTGLGLTIVHNVISAHGGRVQLASQEGRGFRVVVRLPVYEHQDRVQP